jgi:hypothetical protein
MSSRFQVAGHLREMISILEHSIAVSDLGEGCVYSPDNKCNQFSEYTLQRNHLSRRFSDMSYHMVDRHLLSSCTIKTKVLAGDALLAYDMIFIFHVV